MGTNDSAALLPYMAVFVRVVEAGSFSGAARLLGSTPSAVSRQVARLEQAVALRLLERTTRQLRLNEAGAEFYQHCREMLDAADAAVAIGERLMRSPRGLVRLSVPKAYGKFVVGPLMPAFLQRYPEVDVQLRISDQSPDLIEDGFDLLVQVTDTGVGLTPAQIELLRRPFEENVDHLRRGESGLGIGWTFVAYVAEVHGGWTRVTSGGPGQGSCFSLALPQAVKDQR